MKRITLLFTLMVALTISLSGLVDGSGWCSEFQELVIEYPHDNIWDKFFVENSANQHADVNSDKSIRMEIDIPENAGDVDMDEVNRKIEEALKRVEEATRDLDSIPGRSVVSVQIGRPHADSPYMGIVTEDLTLSQAADFGYNKFYGVLITRVVPNSPARAHRMLPDDIIMEINGHRVTNKRILNNIIDSYNIGDTVKMRIFRNRQEMELNFTFGSRHESVDMQALDPAAARRKPKIHVGNLGGGWIPVWFTPNMDEINGLITRLGFTEIDDRGQFLNGGGGKINIGKGLFLGGMGAGYTLERRIAHTTEPDENGASEDVIRRMRYNVRFGGVTLEQRVPITRKLISSFGSMLGWGSTSIEVSQNQGSFQWDHLHQDLDQSVNNYLNLSKSHIFLQPKVELYYRLNDWLSIRSEVGYILSYSYHSGWNIDDSGDNYQVTGSPDSSFDGLTLSIGPWFGF